MADFPGILKTQDGSDLPILADTPPSNHAHSLAARLEKEDVAIIILSAILVVATLWLATYIL